ncbi:hypothetical protein PSHT_02205 [Puccinia striiformis]|uniref:TEA domain-containing protein n=2 Tax=Puccinia striiformis TaxID=27350 RepID=A0A2S4UFF6_9BASI|nr:hypothetical protein PSTT_15902 [Puccinia striiformis]POW21660.1 hypothetical protein PSHT_02205 [Puccinia striiformis]
MTSYDFFAPCSTPKRQRTSSERERFIDLPIEGPSRRKTPAYLDLSGSDFQPFFNGLPLDSPTPKQFAPQQHTRLATHFPNFDIQALGPTENFDLNFNSDLGFGVKSTAEDGLRLPLITHEDLENVDIPFNLLGSLAYHSKGIPQPPSVSVENLLRTEPLLTRSQSYFLEDPWCHENASKRTPESSSYSSLTSLGSTSDCNPAGDYDSSAEAFASTSGFNLNRTNHEDWKRSDEVALKTPETRLVTNSDLNVMDSGSNAMDNDLKRLFNVPLLSLHVTSNFREAQKIINTIRCEATKRQLYSKDRDIWSDEASRAFDEAIRVIPRLGRAKILALTTEGRKPFGRNELIADYIYRRTGIVRHRKQVSSHIQVIKNSKKLDPLSEILDPINHSQSVSFDQCSAIGPYNINHPLKVKRNIVFFSIKWLICGIRERSFDPSFTVGLKEARIRTTTTRSVKTGKTLIGCL